MWEWCQFLTQKWWEAGSINFDIKFMVRSWQVAGGPSQAIWVMIQASYRFPNMVSFSDG